MRPKPRHCPPGRPALTLVEAAVAMLLMSTLLLAALNAAGAARIGEVRVAERARALLLGQQLLGEILQQAYADPENGPTSFGLADVENTGNRSLFDDVDDYNGWTASPPQYQSGAIVANAVNYEESVLVQWVGPANLVMSSGSATGLKRIQVTIKYQGKALATLTAYRSINWLDPVTCQERR